MCCVSSVYTHTYVYIYAYVCVYIYMYVHIHMYIHVNTYVTRIYFNTCYTMVMSSINMPIPSLWAKKTRTRASSRFLAVGLANYLDPHTWHPSKKPKKTEIFNDKLLFHWVGVWEHMQQIDANSWFSYRFSNDFQGFPEKMTSENKFWNHSPATPFLGEISPRPSRHGVPQMVQRLGLSEAVVPHSCRDVMGNAWHVCSCNDTKWYKG